MYVKAMGQSKTLAIGSLALLTGLSLASGGCELIAAVDHDLIKDGGSSPGGGGVGGSTTTSSGGGGAGGGAECMAPADCPMPATDCIDRTCDGGVCGETNKAVATACTQGVCDGMGACVECLDNTQCTAPEVCDMGNNTCVPLACVNTMLDPGETDIDCGGPDCGPCINGDDCLVAGDCTSGFCNALVCAVCTSSAQCGGNEWCDTTVAGGSCVPKVANGTTCAGADECTSGNCAGTFCCDTACSGGCESCAMVNTGSPNGTCANVMAGGDPKSFCPAADCDATSCNGNGACGDAAAATLCGQGPACAGDSLKPQDTCNASGSCIAGTPAACANSFSCDAAASPDVCHAAACADHIECVATHFCGGFMGAGGNPGDCNAKLGTGMTCAVGAECSSGICTALVCD